MAREYEARDDLDEPSERLEELVRERTQDLELTRVEVLERLARVAEYRDDDTHEHAWRVARTSALIAAGLGCPAGEVRLVWRASLVHDIGKVAIPDMILLKPARLTDEEFELVKTHTTTGASILSNSRSPLLRLAEKIALTHHERWDGAGYPRGLDGEKIPYAGRIVAVADVFDALTHSRPYKDAWEVSDALAEIVREAGKQFDPAAVAAFRGLDHEELVGNVEGWDPG